MPRYKITLELETFEQDKNQSYNEVLSAVEEGAQRVGSIRHIEATAIETDADERDQILKDWHETHNFMKCLKRYRERTGASLRESKHMVEWATGERYKG